MTNVFKSSHQTLISRLVCYSIRTVRVSLPFGLGVLPQGRPNKVDFLPALPPLVRILLLGAHVHNFQVVAPSVDVLSLVSHAVSLDSPFSGTLPLHDTTSNICAQDNDKLVAATERSPPVIYKSCK